MAMMKKKPGSGIGTGYMASVTSSTAIPPAYLPQTLEFPGPNGQRVVVPHPDRWAPGDARQVLEFLVTGRVVERSYSTDEYINMANGRGVSMENLHYDLEGSLAFLLGVTDEPPRYRQQQVQSSAQPERPVEKLATNKNPALYEFNEEMGF
jgi:hypothetical protein